MKRSRKVWVGIGAASFVGMTAAAPAHAQHSGHGTAPKAGKDAGALAAPQGGEAYLTDGGPRDTRIRIYRDIILMRGHLFVGGELVALGHWDEALPHFLHPAEELYGQMERYIKLHKVTPFDAQLKAQGQAVKAKNKAAYDQAAKIVDQRLTNALDAFKRFMQGQPFTSFTSRTLAEVFKVAKLEYEASIENDRFTKPVEYQDSRGFVWLAERLLEQHAPDFSRIDNGRLDEIRRLIGELKPAWPAPIPPDKPVLTPAMVGAKVDLLEQALMRFH